MKRIFNLLRRVAMGLLLLVIFNYVCVYFVIAVATHLNSIGFNSINSIGDYIGILAVVGVDVIVSWYAISGIINAIKYK